MFSTRCSNWEAPSRTGARHVQNGRPHRAAFKLKIKAGVLHVELFLHNNKQQSSEKYNKITGKITPVYLFLLDFA